MSRPLKYDEGPLVAVNVDGLVAAWCNNIWTGDRVLVDAAKFAITARMSYVLHGAEVVASDQDILGIAAALGAYRPGRTIFTECPPEVSLALSRNETPEFWDIGRTVGSAGEG